MIESGKGGRVITDPKELQKVRTPPAQGPRHMPIPHWDVWTEMNRGLKRRGIGVNSFELGLSGDRKGNDGKTYEGTSMFGIMNIDMNGQPRGEQRLLGFRASNIQTFSTQMIVGTLLTVCSNGLFSGGSIVLKRKKTTGMDLRREISVALDQVYDAAGDFDKLLGEFKDIEVTNDEARLSLYGLFEEQVLPVRLLRPVSETYFKPKDEWTDTTPRTVWGLYNGITRCLREEPLARRLKFTQEVTDHLDSEYVAA